VSKVEVAILAKQNSVFGILLGTKSLPVKVHQEKTNRMQAI
jgi:hypothetical protein